MPRIRAENIEAHKALVLQEALQAAQGLFDEFGYEHTSIGDVAAAIGVGRTTLYDYFTDKEDLLATLVETSLPETIDVLLSSIPGGLTVDERLGELAIKTVEFVVSDPILGLVLHRELPALSNETQDRIAAAHQDLSKEFASIYRTGVQQGLFMEMAPDVAGAFLQDVIMSAARVLLGHDEPKARLHEVTGSLVQFLRGGLIIS
jgi:AcrR family transcriptional regulator